MIEMRWVCGRFDWERWLQYRTMHWLKRCPDFDMTSPVPLDGYEAKWGEWQDVPMVKEESCATES